MFLTKYKLHFLEYPFSQQQQQQNKKKKQKNKKIKKICAYRFSAIEIEK